MICAIARQWGWTALLMAFGAGALAAAESGGFEAPAEEVVLKTLRAGHPRLIADDAALERLRATIAQDALAAEIAAKSKKEAEELLGIAPSIYEIPDGKRLLSVSRRVKDRVFTLALQCRLEGDARFAQRVWAELEAAANFPDWNPSHFLDTGEMTFAFALGYDWLYDRWSEEQRRILREAIVRMGLEPAMKVYESGSGWPKNENNWNQVCNGGIGTGALAIADEEPALCARILHEALNSIPKPMSFYAPDGAGMEGVTYWAYGTRYNVLFLCALESALGTDFGLSTIPGFAESGDYQMYLSGADRTSFNFGDCGLQRISTPQQFWFGRRFDQPRPSWFRLSTLEQELSDAGEMDLLWFDGSARGFDVGAMPLDKHFRHAEAATMRSAWGDPDAIVLAIQGGCNNWSHRHRDLGSFILEALGERWIVDLGTERQTYLGHQHSYKRTDFYRCRSEGHNTLTINPSEEGGQIYEASCPIVEFESAPALSRATVDLTSAYADSASLARRTFSLVDRAAVVVEDAVEALAPADLWWFAHTQASIALDKSGRAATLEQNGKRLRAELLSPEGARFEAMPAAPLPTSPKPTIGADDSRLEKLAIHLPGAPKANIAVRFAPVK